MEININFDALMQVGIVVPTLGDRENFLAESLKSISVAGCKNVTLVGPINKLLELKLISGLYTNIIDDPGSGLPDAINLGVKAFPENIKYVGWLGDDDLLTKNSLVASLKIFTSNSGVVAT